MAKNSDFPFLKICTPKSMIGYHEAAKVQAIKKIFDDAYKSQLSCIILDSIERLLDYTAIGPRFSNLVLQALLVLLNETPPHGRKLLVLCTTSCKEVLRDMQMLSVFTKIIHVSNISRQEHLIACLEELGVFTSQELDQVRRWASSTKKIWIGIKKLLLLVDAAKQLPVEDNSGSRINKFLSDLEEESESID
jgi:vesicle-fusing ATPase